MSPSRDQLAAAAARVCERASIDATGIELISHSENAVFRVDRTNDTAVALRIHRPGYNTLAQLESEHEWVQALREGGLDVPTAMLFPSDERYLAEPIAGVEHHVGLVEWVEGESLDRRLGDDTDDLEASMRSLGGLMAQVHAISDAWTPPPTFDRRRWDADDLVGLDPAWGRFWEVPVLDAADRARFADARDGIHELLTSFDRSQPSFGLNHADLHLANVMCRGDDLVVIDFDDAGWGFRLSEIAIACAALPPEQLREGSAEIVEGYLAAGGSLPDGQIDHLTTLIALRLLSLIGWMHQRDHDSVAIRRLATYVNSVLDLSPDLA